MAVHWLQALLSQPGSAFQPLSCERLCRRTPSAAWHWPQQSAPPLAADGSIFTSHWLLGADDSRVLAISDLQACHAPAQQHLHALEQVDTTTPAVLIPPLTLNAHH